MTRRLTRVVALFAAAATLAVGCSSGGGGGSGGSKTLTIGISLSLTGDFSDSGTAEQRGYQLWADFVNAGGGLGGRQISLKIVDDASDPNQAATNYTTLITKDHVDLVFGPFSTLLTASSSRIAARYGYAFLEPAGGGPAVFSQHLHNLFFVQPAPAVQQGDVFASYILSLPASQRPKTAAYPALDDPFSSPIANEVRSRLEAAGIRTVYAKLYEPETTDYTPIAAAVAAAKPDLVVGGTQADDGYGLTKAFVQLKWAPKYLYLSNGANSPQDYPDKVGAANVNGVFSSGDWFPQATVNGSAAFIAAYTGKYGGTANAIDPTTAEAYSVGMLLQEVYGKTGKLDNATIISTLHSGSWPTLEGTLTFNADGAANSSYVLVEWIKGVMTAVYPPGVAHTAPVTPVYAWAR